MNPIDNEMGLRMSGHRLREMLQEATYLEKYRMAPALPSDATVDVARHYVSKEGDLDQAKALGKFADCVTFHDTFGADAVLRAPIATPEEKAAAKAIAPSLGACLLQGQTISLSIANVRAILADGLWNRYVRSPGLSMSK